MSRRVEIPPAIRNKVLNEYRHRCAICGADRPELHHIDGDHSNSKDPMNLLPLCPICHHTEQHDPHDPTRPIEPARLRLFREYKDPLILSPQFQPVFRRVNAIFDQSREYENIEEAVLELVRFISTLEMGSFYRSELIRLLDGEFDSLRSVSLPITIRATRPIELSDIFIEDLRQNRLRYLAEHRSSILSLLVEQLRYQKWPIPGHVDSRR